MAQLDKEADGGTPVRLVDSRHPILKRFSPEALALLASWQWAQDRGYGWDELT
ncbi:hypothetical protein [Nocardiopsis sp. FR26]|uniref:hypothetical protein n=1 Tax=Nocardiopsis sp. FR26 TaxID=2605987 RepID=UPI00135BDCDC|nr:hypothetical protein [Nocardiopsis sp. FR26]